MFTRVIYSGSNSQYFSKSRQEYPMAYPSIHTQIPNELLAEIFVNALSIDAVELPLESWHVVSPWTLCQICSRWRQVALNEHRLWNRIHIIESESDHKPSSIVLAHTAFSRSGSLPLELAISLSTDLSEYGERETTQAYDDLFFTDPILSLITEYSTRLRFLSIEIPSLQLMDTLLHLPEKSFISLESIHIGNRNKHRIAEDSMIWRSAPLLRKVDIEFGEYQSPTFPLTLHLPWTQLTTLKMSYGGYVHPLVAHAVVAQSPQLAHYEIGVWGGHGDREVYDKVTDYPPGSIIHHRLRKLLVDVRQFGHSDFDPFIQPLVLPALTEFKLVWHGYGGLRYDEFYDEFVRLAERSQFQLKIAVFPVNAERDDPRLKSILSPLAA
ncbi:hypothetical protein FPV67DRAFT_626178 [Lyophyllum atratum]|nr:hypothetical protein FPV67DRAFT_626178 [Lyophyllum atratum]